MTGLGYFERVSALKLKDIEAFLNFDNIHCTGFPNKSVLMQNRVFRFLMQFSENLITVANFGNTW